MAAASDFILRTLDFSRSERDYIALLQEKLQSLGEKLPDYSHGFDLGDGKMHDFQVNVTVRGKSFSGRGGNTAAAKRAAAKSAYTSLFLKK